MTIEVVPFCALPSYHVLVDTATKPVVQTKIMALGTAGNYSELCGYRATICAYMSCEELFHQKLPNFWCAPTYCLQRNQIIILKVLPSYGHTLPFVQACPVSWLQSRQQAKWVLDTHGLPACPVIGH